MIRNSQIGNIQLILIRILNRTTNSTNSHEYEEINELIRRLSPYYKPDPKIKITREQIQEFEDVETMGNTFIQLRKGEKNIHYDSVSRTVVYFNRHGVLIQCKMPTDFANTRVFQFMDNLFNDNIEEK